MATARRFMPAIAVSGAILFLLAAAVTTIVFNERAYRAQKVDEATVEARILAGTLTAALAFDDRRAALEYVDALEANPEVLAAAVYDAQGDYMVGYARSPERPPPPSVQAGPPQFDGERLIVTAPVQQSGQGLGTVYVMTTTEPFARRAQRYGIIILMLSLAALAFAVLVVAQAALSRANRALAHQAEALSQSNQALLSQIEQREKVEEALRQSQKMEAVGHLTGGVAHDFNNLLHIILGNLDNLRRAMSRAELTLPDGFRRWTDAAIGGAERAATLTQRLLAFSRRQPLDPRPIDANKLVSGMSELLRRTLGEAITTETVQAGGLWQVSADANQLESAILNLAVNARDAMAKGGKLTIETANAHLDDAYGDEHELKPGQYVMIAVTDSGHGMTKEVIAKAFDPFFTTKDVGHGTGLGLSQVYGFVKQSGGHVKIYSEPGEGTTVKLYLPRLSSGAVAGEPSHGQELPVPVATARELVLVVEDDDAVRASTTEMLRQLGYAVLEAADGAAGLRLLDAEPAIALLFSDVGLPGGMNGRQLADRARQRRPELKVLYATGYARNAIVHQGRLDPGVQLIAKPFTYAALARKIREVLDVADA